MELFIISYYYDSKLCIFIQDYIKMPGFTVIAFILALTTIPAIRLQRNKYRKQLLEEEE